MAAYLKLSFVFLVGFSIGVILALLLFVAQNFPQSELLSGNEFVEHFTLTSYHSLFKKMRYLTFSANFDELTYSNNATLHAYLASSVLEKKIFVLCVMSVSYTHLDVYKRQVL